MSLSDNPTQLDIQRAIKALEQQQSSDALKITALGNTVQALQQSLLIVDGFSIAPGDWTDRGDGWYIYNLENAHIDVNHQVDLLYDESFANLETGIITEAPANGACLCKIPKLPKGTISGAIQLQRVVQL